MHSASVKKNGVKMDKSKETNKQQVKSLPLNSSLTWLVTLYLVSSKTPHYASSQNFYLQSRVNTTFLAHCQVVKNMFRCCNDDDDSIIFKGQIMEFFIAPEIYFLVLL